jgi:hypothetical protein
MLHVKVVIVKFRISHGDMLQSLIPDAFWVKGEDSSETRDYVFSQLRTTDKKKVVAIIRHGLAFEKKLMF